MYIFVYESYNTIKKLNVSLHVTVDPTSSRISGPERGGSVTLCSGIIARSHGIQASSTRRTYSDISSKVLKVDTIPRFPGKSSIRSH
jgi:hypothetical protein